MKIMICQLGGMFEIENQMAVVIITSSLHHLYMQQAPAVAPVCASALCHIHQQSSAVPTQR